jgi:hypothetical protein
VDVPKLLDDERQRLLVIPHAAEEEHHLGYEAPFVADLVRLRTVLAGAFSR